MKKHAIDQYKDMEWQIISYTDLSKFVPVHAVKDV